MIRLWAKIYQLTGWYCPLARVQEYKALKVWVKSELGRREIDGTGPESIFYFIGTWQADNGFYRTFRRTK